MTVNVDNSGGVYNIGAVFLFCPACGHLLHWTRVPGTYGLLSEYRVKCPDCGEFMEKCDGC